MKIVSLFFFNSYDVIKFYEDQYILTKKSCTNLLDGQNRPNAFRTFSQIMVDISTSGACLRVGKEDMRRS
jgi:hypothetical protein